MKKYNVAIVDDQRIFRLGLRFLLENIEDVKSVIEAENGLNFIELLRKRKKIDLVFIDIKMPVMNGIEAAKLALKRDPDLKIIAITMFHDKEYFDEMMALGVKGFLSKSIEYDELKSAIDAVMNGEHYFSGEILEDLTNRGTPFSAAANQQISKKVNKDTAAFTNREIEVLKLICEGKSTNEMAEILNISNRTVDGHRASLISKSGVKNTAGLVMFAINNKFVLPLSGQF